mmetsp:Transcript_40755/g.126785  ORF Transcript_40755/g.126785 Transcript_40755/m.126785 type:complete len:318 (-) Transcript_40755:5-958(-)
MDRQDKMKRKGQKCMHRIGVATGCAVGALLLLSGMVCYHLKYVEEPVVSVVSTVVPPALRSSPSNAASNIAQLEEHFRSVEQEVRNIKATGVIMETDDNSARATRRLQDAARALCKAKYGDFGDAPYHIRVAVRFQQESLTDAERRAEFTIETAPLKLIPYSVYNFLEVVRGYREGGFHRKAEHVLQVSVSSVVKKPLAFQEYSSQFPHKKMTVGYCGRPSGGGGCWYISTIDNTRNHGPGSQQKRNPYEADASFGRVIESDYRDVEPRIRKALPQSGFIGDKKDWVLITNMTVLVPDGKGGYVEWRDGSVASAAMR